MSKSTEPVPKADCELQAKDNMLFSGTAIANGIVSGCVCSIGMDTEMGKIQNQIQVCTGQGWCFSCECDRRPWLWLLSRQFRPYICFCTCNLFWGMLCLPGVQGLI